MTHPNSTPLEEWPQGWLVLEIASRLDYPQYLMMHDHEKRAAKYPVTREEMIAYIKEARGK